MEGTGEKKGRGRGTNGGASPLLYLSLVLLNDRRNTSDAPHTVHSNIKGTVGEIIRPGSECGAIVVWCMWCIIM